MNSSKTSQKVVNRVRRHARVRSRISGTADRPRLAVFRSNKFIYAQLIDDVKSVTIAQSNDMKLKGTKVEKATAVGKEIATLAKAAKIESIVFDRGGFHYTGRVQALADAAREAGLTF